MPVNNVLSKHLLDKVKNVKPLSVSVIGWIFATLGFFMTIGAVAFYLFNSKFDIIFEDAIFDSDINVFDFFVNIYKYYEIFSLVQFLLGGFMLISGIYFLKLKSWARTAIDALSKFFLAMLLIFTVYWGYLWLDFEGFPESNSVVDWSMMKVVAIFIGVFSLAVYGGLLYIIIMILRSKKVRSLMIR